MTSRNIGAKAKLIQRAMDDFPSEVRRQENAHREEMKMKKQFGKLDLRHKSTKRTTAVKKANSADSVHPWRI